MNFYEFYQLLNENTVSQELKKYKQNEFLKKRETVKTLLEEIKKHLFQRNALNNINENSKNIIANWVMFLYLKKYNEQYPGWLNNLNNITGKIALRSAEGLLDDMINRARKMVLDLALYVHFDYIAANIDDDGNLNPVLSSKFNNPNFSLNDIVALDQQYHNDLRDGKIRIPGAPGITILEFDDGYKWIDLGRGSCNIEGKAGKHCGNINAQIGDTILSLRDRRNNVHLTFILNNGVLVERKAAGNSKPTEKFHKYIIELLKLPIVKSLGPGRYLPKNDFQLSDLSEDQAKELIKIKPNMEENYYRQKLISGKEVPEHVLAKYIENGWEGLVAKYSTNIEILEKILNDNLGDIVTTKKLDILTALAANEKTPKEILSQIYYEIKKDGKISIIPSGTAFAKIKNHNLNITNLLAEISTNKNVPKSIMMELLENKFYKVLSNPKFPVDVMKQVVEKHHYDLRKDNILFHIIRNPNTPSSVLTLISIQNNLNINILVSLMDHPNTSVETLRMLANRPDETISRYASAVLKIKHQENQ